MSLFNTPTFGSLNLLPPPPSESKMTATMRKRALFSNGSGCFLFLIRGTFFVLLMFWALWSGMNQLIIAFISTTTIPKPNTNMTTTLDNVHDNKTFYDDPELSYSVENLMNNWDEKRSHWLQLHPSFASISRDRVLLVTGSQPSPCKNSVGDHLLLRCFKNKVDYCRIHGCEVYYNSVNLHPKMGSYWAKLQVIRSAMMAHPEAEWIWWLDSDAVFTDMEFSLPLDRYKNHNLVVHGWSNMVYDESENKSWTGLNAGSVLIRNCQWSMDLLHSWVKMGPLSSNYEKWGRILTSVFKDKPFPLSDDQSSLIYLLSRQRRKWGGKTYLEGGYSLESYWIGMLGRFEGINDGYEKVEVEAKVLRRRHAEKLSVLYGEFREHYLRKRGWDWLSRERRPFVTHFTGCQPCSGDHNPSYDGDTCWREMERALNFADNQVLRNYGFVRKDLLSSDVHEVPFDFPM